MKSKSRRHQRLDLLRVFTIFFRAKDANQTTKKNREIKQKLFELINNDCSRRNDVTNCKHPM